MKRLSLITTLAMLLFAVTATAQSDPSVGGSFGTSFDHRAVSGGALSGTTSIGETTSVDLPQQAFTTSSRAHIQPQRSFWDRLTGRNRNTPAARASHSDRSSHSWFGHHQAAPSQNLRSSAHLQSHHRQGRANVHASANAHRNSWLMPFFGRS